MLFLVSIVSSLILLDQLTKLLVVWLMPLHSAKEVIPGFFNIVHTRNTGAAFSFLADANAAWRQPLFIVLTIFIIGILLWSYRKIHQNDHWTRTAYALIVGGAVGNLADRVRLGYVVDFLDVYVGTYHWPAFNVADSAITVGALMLLVSLVRGK